MTKRVQHAEWTMPEWMEPYRNVITNTGGNPIEDLMNDHDSNMFNNAVRAALCIAVASQVSLLEKLHNEGRLVEVLHG